MSSTAVGGSVRVHDNLRNWKLVFWLLIGSALLLRLWGVRYGLPYVYWIDEYHEVMRALELGSGGFNLSRTSKGGFYYLLFFEYGVYYVFLKLSGFVAGTKEFAEHFARDPSMFYLMGRVTAALFGAATVAVCYFLGRKAYSAYAGMFAALFAAVNILHVDLSHRVGVDVPMTMLAALTLYFGIKIADSGERRDYLLAGLFAALATTTKLPAVLLVVPLLIAHGFAVSNAAGGIREWVLARKLWYAVLLFAVVLVLTNPGILFRAGHIIAAVFGSAGATVDPSAEFDEAQMPLGDVPNLYLFYLRAILASMGWPLFLFGLVSVAYAIWKRRPSDVMLVSYALVNYLAVAGTTSEGLYYPRYSRPIIVVLVVLAGRLVGDLLLAVPRRRSWVAVVIAVVLVSWPASQVYVNNQVLGRTDTRTLAKDWIDTHVPSGSHVLIEGGKIAPSRETVQLSESPESLDRRIAYWLSEDPRQARFLQIKRAVQEGVGYRLEIVKPDTLESFDAYIDRGVEYFVVRPENLERSRRAEIQGVRLLERLRNDPAVSLIKAFETEPGVRRGPRVEVYQVRPEGATAQ